MDSCAINARNLKTRFGPDGLYCFDRKTGINILLDEVYSPEKLWARAPRQVSIALTNTCDLSCSHCYAPKHRALLELDLLREWLVDLDANGCMSVGLGGGEPTLYPFFTDLCNFVANNTALALTMTTHGHRLTPEIMNAVALNVNFVRVSMDGINSTYESIRGKPFKEFIEKVSSLSQVVPFGINFVVNHKTITNLAEAVDLAEKLGASEFLLLPEVAIRRGSEIDLCTKGKMQNWIRNYNGPIKLSIREGNADGIQVCEPFEKEIGLSAYAHIDAGGVLKTSSFEKKGIPIPGSGIMKAIEILQH